MVETRVVWQCEKCRFEFLWHFEFDPTQCPKCNGKVADTGRREEVDTSTLIA